MINQVIHGDCFEVLKDIPDGSIDAVITDPPYMTTDLNFDKTGFDVDLFLKLLLPKLKSDGQLAVFGSIELLAKFSGIYPIRWSGMWLKPRGVMRTHTAKKPMSKSEPYCIFAHPKHKVSNLVYNKILLPGEPYEKKQKNTGYIRDGKNQIDRANASAWTKDDYVSENHGTRQQTDVIESPFKGCMKHHERTIHPTQKPVALISTLVRWISNPGDLVLDPFAGSGTTAIACKELNRNYICIEKEREYVDIIHKRLNTPITERGLTVEEQVEIEEKIKPGHQQLSLF
jgi:site-specific DNA-methyltransferase (adenine-specific)